ncbi:MAG: hypothetical protein EOP64_00010 [Sphingomonas sp.]|nr:MAG: hypothetical protein EOP64_00010 [Sphingomonas sp.]
MVQVSLNVTTWSEARFTSLCGLLRVPHPTAVGVILMLSGRSRMGGLDIANRQDIWDMLPVEPKDRDTWFDALYHFGYIQKFGDEGFVVEGNARWFAISAQKRAAGRSRQAQRRARIAAGEPAAQGSYRKVRGVGLNARKARHETWKMYVDEFQARYHMQPPRNAAVNTELADFVARMGHNDAPSVIRFYVRNHSLEYIHDMHSMRLLMRDAEALKAQWQRGEVAGARQALSAQATPRSMRQGSLWAT